MCLIPLQLIVGNFVYQTDQCLHVTCFPKSHHFLIPICHFGLYLIDEFKFDNIINNNNNSRGCEKINCTVNHFCERWFDNLVKVKLKGICLCWQSFNHFAATVSTEKETAHRFSEVMIENYWYWQSFDLNTIFPRAAQLLSKHPLLFIVLHPSSVQ